MSAPLRSDVSRQQSRLFNDLQGHRVPNSATAFDKCRRIVLKEKIPLTKGRLPEASREVERVRFPRADLQSAPGRLRASCPPVLWPVRGVLPLGWDRKARVTPGRTASQETWPGAEPGGQSLGERRGGAPKGERAAISARPCSAEYGHGRCAFSALRLPLFFWRRKISRLWSAKLGCGCVARTRSLAPSAPAKRGSICVDSQAYIGARGCQVRSSLTRVFARTTSFLATAMRATFDGFPLSMSRL